MYCNTVQYSTVQYSTVNTVQYSTAQHTQHYLYITPHNTKQHNITLTAKINLS